MKVKELINQLQDFDEELEVCFSYNYGDYPKTMVAENIHDVDESEVVYSDYHRMNRIVDDDREGDRENSTVVVILK